MHRLLNQLAASASDLQNEVIERRAAQDVDVVGCVWVSDSLSVFRFFFLLVGENKQCSR